jgi:hypothetical protein
VPTVVPAALAVVGMLIGPAPRPPVEAAEVTAAPDRDASG